MTWARVKETGSGAIAFRIMIPGHPYEFVSSTALAGASTHGRIRVAGLVGSSVTWGERLDPAQCKLTGSGFTARVIEDGSHRTGDSFVRQPTRVLYLTASVTSGATSITVSSTDAATNDVIFIGQECMLVTAGGGTTTLTVTRAYRETLAQSHIAATADLTQPEVTIEDAGLANGRPSVKGLLAYVYAYGDGETGDGTLVWRGICGEPRTNQLTSWDLPIGSVTAILEQTLSADLQDPVSLRGIIYTSVTAPVLRITRKDTAAISGAPTTDTAVVTFAGGFYETQEAWCAAVNTTIASATSGWGINALNVAGGAAPRLTAIPTIDGSWTLQFTAAAVPLWMTIELDGPLDPSMSNSSGYMLDQSSGAAVWTLIASTTYNTPTSYPIPGAGTVPRGVLGRLDEHTPGYSGGGGFLQNTLYLGGSATATTSDALLIEWPDFADRRVPYAVTTWTAATRSAVVSLVPRGTMPHYWTRESQPKITILRVYVALGNAGDFITELVTSAPDEAPAGRSPMVTTRHVDYTATQAAVDDIAIGRAWVRNRYYAGSSDASLGKMLVEEAKLLGMVPTITTSGQWSLVEFRIGAATEASAYTINASTNLSSAQRPGFEPSAYGLVNTIKLMTGFDPLTGKHVDLYVLRDMAALARQPIPSAMKIEPRSEAASGDDTIPISDVVALAQSWLGVLASAYTSITITCPLSAMDAVIGTLVSITVEQLPDTANGGRGVASIGGFIIGRQCRPMSGQVELTMLATQLRIAGYTPSSRTSSGSVTAGATRVITLDLAQPSGYATAAAWTIGDAVILRQYDTAAPTEITATVTATDPAARTVTIGTISGLTPAGVLNLEYGVAGAAQTSQQAYCYVAATDRTITWAATSVPARQFAS